LTKIVTNGEDGWASASFEELPHAAVSGYESILAAEREAEAIVLSARESTQQIEREAHREGFTRGHTEAIGDMRRQIEQLDALLREACRQVAAAHQAVATQTEGELIELAIAVAKQVVQSEIEARPDAMVLIVKTALEAAGSRKVMAIRVNPGDYELLAEHRGDLLDSLESARLVSDPAISFGGCLIEVETGLVDVRLESQLQEAARLLGRNQNA